MNWNIFGSLSVPLPWRTETTTEKPKTLSYEEFVRLKSKYTGSKTEHATSTSAPTIKKTFTSLSLEEFRLLRSQMKEKTAKDKLKERNYRCEIKLARTKSNNTNIVFLIILRRCSGKIIPIN